MPRVTKVKKARKPNSVVTQEDIDNHTEENGRATYYWWKHKLSYGGLRRESKTYPRPSQLTLSEYYSTLYSIRENFDDCEKGTAEDLQCAFESAKLELEELRDNQQEKLDNMPESLQYSPTGETLQERLDSCENAVNELDCVDIDESEYEELETDEEKENWLEERVSNIQEALESVE